MIFSIETKTEYGYNGQGGIYPVHVPELSGAARVEYAHSKEQALAFVNAKPAFAEFKATNPNDVGEIFNGEWISIEETMFALLYVPEDTKLTHVRTVVSIYPMNTVFEK